MQDDPIEIAPEHRCADCGDPMPNAIGIGRCEDCNINYFNCEHCGGEYPVDESCLAPDGNYYCESCSNRLTVYCSECDETFMRSEHHSCFDCNLPKRHSETFNRNPSKRFVGIELEYCAENALDFTCSHGTTKEEGTDGVDGEFALAPYNGDRLFAAIEQSCWALCAYGATINTKCGMHVHLDMTGSTTADRNNICAWWGALEPIFFAFTAASRRTNYFCLALGPRSREWTDHRFVSLETNEAYRSHNTFECRIHHGTLTTTHIIGWTTLLLAFFDTFQSIDPTDRVEQVISMTHREKLIFLFQQCKLPLSFRKFLVRRLKRFKEVNNFHGYTLHKPRKDAPCVPLEVSSPAIPSIQLIYSDWLRDYYGTARNAADNQQVLHYINTNDLVS